MDVILHHQTLTLTQMLMLTLTILDHTLSYHTLSYYTVSYQTGGWNDAECLAPTFHDKNAVPILYCQNIIIICPAPPHDEISSLSQQSITCISASLWMLKLYAGKFSAPNLLQCSMSEENKKGRLVVACGEYCDFLLVNYLIGSRFP